MTSHSQPTTGYAPVDGGKLYYEVAGAGDALVLMHAGIADCRMWDDQFAVFAEKFRVIRYDVRGFGRSDVPTGPFSTRADLKALLAHLGIASAHLVGASMSGSIAIDFTIENPSMVESLVLVGSGLSGHQASDATKQQWAAIGQAAEAGDRARALELTLHMWVDGPARRPEEVNSAVREKVREMEAHNLEIDTDAGVPIRLEPPAIGRLVEIQVPTLVVVGDGDQPDILEIADLLVEGIPLARIEVLPRVAHVPNLEEPDEFNRIVLDFLREVRGE